MSASEKLKALDAPLPTNLGEWGDEVRKRGAIFLDALPQIVAVVEAAEVIRNQWQRPGGTQEEAALANSLAALEEALGGDVT